jgi:hypothetical protein
MMTEAELVIDGGMTGRHETSSELNWMAGEKARQRPT